MFVHAQCSMWWPSTQKAGEPSTFPIQACPARGKNGSSGPERAAFPCVGARRHRDSCRRGAVRRTLAAVGRHRDFTGGRGPGLAVHGVGLHVVAVGPAGLYALVLPAVLGVEPEPDAVAVEDRRVERCVAAGSRGQQNLVTAREAHVDARRVGRLGGGDGGVRRVSARVAPLVERLDVVEGPLALRGAWVGEGRRRAVGCGDRVAAAAEDPVAGDPDIVGRRLPGQADRRRGAARRGCIERLRLQLGRLGGRLDVGRVREVDGDDCSVRTDAPGRDLEPGLRVLERLAGGERRVVQRRRSPAWCRSSPWCRRSRWRADRCRCG